MDFHNTDTSLGRNARSLVRIPTSKYRAKNAKAWYCPVWGYSIPVLPTTKMHTS